MNKIYRLVWNVVHQSWVPAPEVSKSRSKANGQRSRRINDNAASPGLSLSVGLSVSLLSLASPAMAQQIKADGTTVNRSDAVSIDISAGNSAGYGLWATNGGKINADGGANVTTRGVNAPAVMAEGINSAISINGGALQNIGSVGNAASSDINARYATVVARGQGSVVLDGVSVANNYKQTADTLDGTGLLAQSAGSSIEMTGGQLSGNQGAQARDGGTIVLNNVAVIGQSQGVYTSGAGAVLTMNGGSIDIIASTFRGEAVLVGGDSTINLNGVDIENSNATIDSITGHGALVLGTGTANIDNSTIHTYGSKSNGVQIGWSATSSNGGTVNIGGGSIISDLGAGILAQGSDSTATITNASITGATAGLSLNNGAQSSATNSAITATGDSGYGVQVNAGSKATLSGGSVTATGGDAYGLYATSAGSQITANSTTVTSTKHGVHVDAGGKATLSGGNVVSASDINAHGLHASGAGSEITTNNTTITSTGRGVHVEAGGKATLNAGSRVSAAGSIAYGLYATGADSQITANFTTTTSTGEGVHVGAGGKAALNGGSVTVTGDGAYGLYATGADSRITANRTTITSTGSGGSVVYAEAGSRIDLQDLDVVGTEGVRGIYTGIGVDGAQITANNVNVKSSARGVDINVGGSFTMSSGSIESTGDAVILRGSNSASTATVATISNATLVSEDGYGVNINGSHASATLSNVAIQTKGDYDSGVWLPSEDTTLIANNFSITTLGTQAMGIENLSGSVTLGCGRISTSGNNAYGLYAASRTGGSPSISATCVGIKTTGVGAVGAVSFFDGSRILLDDVSITTSGAQAHGLAASNKGAVIEVRNSMVTTSGDSAHGLRMSDSAQVSVESSSIGTSGNNAAAVWSYATVAGTTPTNTLPVIGSRLETQNAPAILVSGGNHQLTLTDSEVIGRTQGSAETGTLLLARKVTVNGVAMPTYDVSLKATRSNLVGDVLVDSGKASILLNDGSILSGALRGTSGGVVSSVSIDAGSTWNVRGDSVIEDVDNTGAMTGRLNNAGTVAFVAPVSDDGFKTLTIKGDYVGNGGTLAMNTALGDDASLSDKLVVQGDAHGETFVQVKNANGAGAVTDSGIQLISVAGVSDAVFKLDGRAVAGLYDYQLYKGGRNTTDDGGWYLRSEALPVPPIDPPAPPVDPEIVDPPAPIDPTPTLRPEPAAYLGNQNAALRMFQHTMHDRVGEPGLTARDDDGQGYAAWVRVQNRNLDAGTVGGQIDIDTNANIMQMGVEKQFVVGEGRVHAGVMGGYGRATTDGVSNFTTHRSRGEVKGNNLGVYGTWFQNAEGPEGLYVDGWMQYGRFDNTVKGDYLGHEQYDSKVWSGSVEAGYGFNVHSGERYGVYVEPQAQVIYTDFSSDDVREDNGTLVQSRKAGGTTTRLGARVYSRPLGNAKNRVQPFAAVNWWSGGNASTIAMDGERLSRDLPKNTYEAKVGAQLELGQGWSGWGQVGYQQGSNGYRDLNGQVGVKLSW